MLYDSLIKNLITQAYLSEKDVFFSGIPDDIRNAFEDNVKTVFLMPAAFSCGGEDDFSDIRNYPCSFDAMKKTTRLFADVRFMSDESFRAALTENGFERIAVLFPECADISEYGYRQTYSWIGEYRAERQGFVQVAGFMAPCGTSVGSFGSLLGKAEALVVGDDGEIPEFCVFEAVSIGAKFYAAAASAEKYAFDRTVIYFNSRQEARSFRSFMRKRGTDCLLLDGSTGKDERYELLTDFMLGRTNLLIATKAYIPSSFFCPPERVIFCGIPFSVSHLYRGACCCKKRIPEIIYCEEDILRNEKIIMSFSQALEESEITEKRLKSLENIKNLLKSSQ